MLLDTNLLRSGGDGTDDGTDENAFGMGVTVVCVGLVFGCYKIEWTSAWFLG